MSFTFLIHNLRMQYPLPEISPVFMALENTAPLVCAVQLLCLFIINSTPFAWHGHVNESRAAERGSGLCLQTRLAWGIAHCPGLLLPWGPMLPPRCESFLGIIFLGC